MDKEIQKLRARINKLEKVVYVNSDNFIRQITNEEVKELIKGKETTELLNLVFNNKEKIGFTKEQFVMFTIAVRLFPANTPSEYLISCLQVLRTFTDL